MSSIDVSLAKKIGRYKKINEVVIHCKEVDHCKSIGEVVKIGSLELKNPISKLVGPSDIKSW